ncbi:hypothetical protein WJX75_009065 [Coccomyxa subellipsoidea]|uniref:CCT domain-containing protein n=1 Tax=Coccomyxa subellipsoidea TaxID=248742 RepID=A0ABR2YNN4_9CHLO
MWFVQHQESDPTRGRTTRRCLGEAGWAGDSGTLKALATSGGRVQATRLLMGDSLEDVARLSRGGQQNAPEWERTREESHFSSSYDAGDKPMTREEADDFDKLSMGSCFLEFGSFEDRTSRDEPGEASLRTIASQSAAEALQIFQAEGVLSRSSMDAGSRRMQASGSTDGDPGSNRSSVDTVPAAASSMLYKSSSWEEGSKATQGLASQQDLVRQPLAAKAQQVQMRNQQAAVQAAAQGGAPANARAARQALCLGLPDSRPRLNLTQKEVVQTSLQQMQTQQGAPEQAQQQHRKGTTPVLQQSYMQLSLGMGLGLKLDLGSWHYGLTTGNSAGDTAAAVTPRSTAAAHRRRAGAPVELYPSEQACAEKKPHADPPAWPTGMGVAAVALQNVRCNHPGTAFTSAGLVPTPAETQAAQAAVCADFAQKFAAAVKQEALQSSHRQFEHAVGNSSLKNAAARTSSKSGGHELSVRHESLERYRDKKRRRVFSNSKTIRYEKRKVNADRRPRVKGRFVKEMDVDMDTALEMIDEHSQVQPPPDTGMEHASQHASDAECSWEDEDPPHSSLDGEGDTCIVESCPS